jgi:molybdopterin-biosynthesis enzyme MoeA-like protein
MTGNELMSGDTIDSNSSLIAQSLSKYGFDILSKITIGDDINHIANKLENLLLEKFSRVEFEKDLMGGAIMVAAYK